MTRTLVQSNFEVLSTPSVQYKVTYLSFVHLFLFVSINSVKDVLYDFKKSGKYLMLEYEFNSAEILYF